LLQGLDRLPRRADGVLALALLDGTFVPGGILEVGWLAPVAALAYVAWVPAPQPPAAGASRGAILMPVVFGLAGATAFLLEALEPEPDHVVVALGFATTVAVFGRFVLTSHDNLRLIATTHVEATTDALTGLGNRRRLAADLSAAGGGARALVIFDLDGFKRYNDTFGHPAGDGLLRLIGDTLASAVAGRGGAYRMGGDEFCALIDFDGRDADAVGAELATAMRQSGQGFSIGASFGTVRLPEEAATPEDALRLADRRMYARKHSRRAAPDRQSADVLLAIVAERDPGLGRHAGQVAAMAVAVASELGIGDGEPLEVIRRAAELHDIGKVAIPESILNKPGPLDPDETALIRQHTVIGERILSAAPALAPVGRLVRSSHERWDGAGYPDGRAGSDIPLGARIVFVCDAFDAMVSERPYHDGMAPSEALAELVRCAGTQFDPRVVAAFAAVMDKSAVPA
jgi:diguanylate cyclase (GGDEF)-like protein/putative nucleotidyltransferase with HDIG domain